MGAIFSPHTKYTTWRKLWVSLAKAEKELGLPITDKQIASLESHVETIDYTRVREIEKNIRHDVMAHLHAFGEQCPNAKGILHLGATSAFVTDNTDLILIKKGLQLLIGRSLALIRVMASLAEEYQAFPTVGYTHFQPAQPTTVGKRICLWLQDLFIDTKDLLERLNDLHFLGVKGATGTQASFMILWNHEETKVKKLDELVAKEMGFAKIFKISGQTYTRKQDMRIFSTLEGLAASSHKCATDLRLLSNIGELIEGREERQVGSSAMPHKHNPIYSERICSLARFLLSLGQNGGSTLATQWLERSLDDSANRRIVIPEIFLTADAILCLLLHVFTHLSIDPEMIEKNLKEYLPKLALENILMYATKKGKDRQEVHEKLRKDPHSAREWGLSDEEINLCNQAEIGRAQEQVSEFLNEEIFPFLEKYKEKEVPFFELDV